MENKEIFKIEKKHQITNLEDIYREFMEIFDVEIQEELIEHLKQMNVPTKSVCAKELKRGVGAWVCKDCEKDSSCVICNECYEKSKDKHANHKKYFKSSVSGCCDCGDPDSWDPAGFCTDHQGLIRSDEEIDNLINNTFDKPTLTKILQVFHQLFNLLTEIIGLYELTKDTKHITTITEVTKYLEELASSNLAILHLIVQFFLQNYSMKTNHTCFKLNQKTKKIEKMKETDTLDKHECSCSFFQNLIRIWNTDFDEKMKIDKILYAFLKSYKFKYLYAFTYLSLYDTIMINDSERLKSFSVQIMTIEDIAEDIVKSEEFVNNLFEKLYYLTNYYLDGEEENIAKNLDNLFKITFEFFMDINYLSKPRPAKIMSKYTKNFKILIDVLAIIQGRIKFKPANSFQYEGFQENFVSVELYLLNLFSLLTTNFDFEETENADEVLFYLMDKIRNKAHNKISYNEFTFHIPLNRAFSIFINRYSFSESVKLNIDLFMAVKNNLCKYYNKLFSKDEGVNLSTNNKENTLSNYDFEHLLLDLTRETLKFVGFINSIPCKLWVYYGENMLYYNICYYAYDTFYLCDLTLLKLILSQDHKSEIINLQAYLKLTDVNNSYSAFMNDLLFKDKYTDSSAQSLFIKNLDYMIRLLRNNIYIVDLLAHSYDKVKSSKTEDFLLSKYVLNEFENFKESIRLRLVHIILSRSNSIYYSEITKLLPYYVKEFMNQAAVEELLSEMCDKVVSKNKPVLFKLKEDFLKKSDIFFIIDPKSITNAEKYLLEFKQNSICLLNTPEYHTFDFIKIVNGNFANHFFQNEGSITKCVDLTINFLKKINTKSDPSPNFTLMFNIMKIMDIFINASIHNGYLLKYEVKLMNKELIDNLSNIKTSDNNLDCCARYLAQRILDLYSKMKNINSNNPEILKLEGNLVQESTNTGISEAELRKLKMKEMKDKTAAMFKNKGNLFKKNFNISSVEDSEESISNNVNNTNYSNSTVDNSNSLSKNVENTENSNIFGNLNTNVNTFINTMSTMNNLNSNINININPLTSHLLSLPEEPHNKVFDCIICRTKINSREFFTKPFGRIGVFSSNSFIYHSKLQTLKKEYEKLIIKAKTEKKHLEDISMDESESHHYSGHTLNSDEQLFVKDMMVTYKRSKPEMKKTLRFISCNHYVHFSCYLTLIVKYMISQENNKQFLFLCPLCKTMSNAFIPTIDYTNLIKNEESGPYLKGFTFAEVFSYYRELTSQNGFNLENNLSLFKIKRDDKFVFEDSVIYSVSHYLEKIVSLQGKCSFLLNDFKNKVNQFRYYEYMRNFFINSLNLTDILKNDEYEKSLDILKDYILSIKILLKANLLDSQIFFSRLLQILFYWNTDFTLDDFMSYNIESDKVSQLFFENVYLVLILFEDSELNYLNIIFKNFLPLFLIQFFILQMYIKCDFKLSLEQFEKYYSFENFMYLISSASGNSQMMISIKTFLTFHLKKAVLVKHIYRDNKRIKDKFTDVNEEFAYYCEELGIVINNPIDFKMIDFLKTDETIYPSFWTYREDIRELTLLLFNRYSAGKLKHFTSLPQEGDSINPSLLLITNNLKFNFINIPSNLIDLSMKYYKLTCHNCNTNPNYAILCLVCGEKICYTDTCCKNYGRKKNVYEYIWHTKICGAGDGVYLHLYNGEITLALLGNFVSTRVGIYLNKFGESLKGRSITDEYVLNEDLLQNFLHEYTSLSYRNHFRSQGNVYLMEDEEDM